MEEKIKIELKKIFRDKQFSDDVPALIGIGMLKAQWMDKGHGKAMEIYRRLKKVVDLNNIMNPGKMGF